MVALRTNGLWNVGAQFIGRPRLCAKVMGGAGYSDGGVGTSFDAGVGLAPGWR